VGSENGWRVTGSGVSAPSTLNINSNYNSALPVTAPLPSAPLHSRCTVLLASFEFAGVFSHCTTMAFVSSSPLPQDARLAGLAHDIPSATVRPGFKTAAVSHPNSLVTSSWSTRTLSRHA